MLVWMFEQYWYESSAWYRYRFGGISRVVSEWWYRWNTKRWTNELVTMLLLELLIASIKVIGAILQQQEPDHCLIIILTNHLLNSFWRTNWQNVNFLSIIGGKVTSRLLITLNSVFKLLVFARMTYFHNY